MKIEIKRVGEVETITLETGKERIEKLEKQNTLLLECVKTYGGLVDGSWNDDDGSFLIHDKLGDAHPDKGDYARRVAQEVINAE